MLGVLGVGEGEDNMTAGTNQHRIPCTDERVERLKTLHAEGLSMAEIALDLGGVSRNAVIGKSKRLNLKLRRIVGDGVKFRRPRNRQAVRIHPKAMYGRPQVETASLMPQIAPGQPCRSPPSVWKELVDLAPGDCRYPFGDESTTYLFCASEIADGAYCATHAARCFNYRPAPRLDRGFMAE